MGSFLVTASWLNWLTYFHHLPYCGIFILMLVELENQGCH